MPKQIRQIASTLMRNPTEVKIKSKEMTVSNIDQKFIEVHEKQKFDALANSLDIYVPELAIVFCRTKKRVDEVADGLNARGFQAEGIHGDLTQGNRLSVLNKFKNRRIEILEIDQKFIEVHEKQKFDALANSLDIYVPELAIVFCRTKKRVDEVADGLNARGFQAEGIHGDLTQGNRLSVLNKFKNRRIEILVATED